MLFHFNNNLHANSMDQDHCYNIQTDLFGAVWSGSRLFAFNRAFQNTKADNLVIKSVGEQLFIGTTLHRKFSLNGHAVKTSLLSPREDDDRQTNNRVIGILLAHP